MPKINNKLTRSALYISQHEPLFKCPICDSAMKVQDLKSLACSNRHTFDISKQGYLNLMTNNIQTNYDKNLFEARREVIADSGFFTLFNTEITKMISEQTASKNKLFLVDMGSGEGSHLHNIGETLQSHFNKSVTGVGIDISREGILEAAKHYDEHIWIVADLAKTPLGDGTFDVMLNILSPSNYEEFNRLLKDDGVVIKVVPRKNYLKELRKYFYKGSEKKDYSNTKIVDHFKDNFKLVDHSVVHYTKKLDQSSLQSLIKMTPLTWGVSEDEISHFLDLGETEVTVDLDILIGIKTSG